MKTFKQLVAEHEQHVAEIMPWDLEEKLNQDNPPTLLDVREAAEFSAMHIKGSINVPRGILEIVCDNDNKENATELINARNQEIAVICGSGKRSVMASSTMKKMGYTKSISLKTGLKGWNDYNLPLIDKNGNNINPDKVETYLNFDTKPTQFTHRK